MPGQSGSGVRWFAEFGVPKLTATNQRVGRMWEFPKIRGPNIDTN